MSSITARSNHGPWPALITTFHGLVTRSWPAQPKGKHRLLCSCIKLMGVTSLGRHTRPACNQGLLESPLSKKNDFDLNTVCFSLTCGDARGLGLVLSVCACAVGPCGNALIWMRGSWGVFWRSAHVPTIPFTWLRRAKALGRTAHAYYHHACMCLAMNACVLYPMPGIPLADWLKGVTSTQVMTFQC